MSFAMIQTGNRPRVLRSFLEDSGTRAVTAQAYADGLRDRLCDRLRDRPTFVMTQLESSSSIVICRSSCSCKKPFNLIKRLRLRASLLVSSKGTRSCSKGLSCSKSITLLAKACKSGVLCCAILNASDIQHISSAFGRLLVGRSFKGHFSSMQSLPQGRFISDMKWTSIDVDIREQLTTLIYIYLSILLRFLKNLMRICQFDLQ